MRRSVLLVLLLASPAAAQPGGFGGVTPDQFFRSNVALAAGQLTAELNAVRAELARASAPMTVRFTTARLAGQAIQQSEGLQRLAQAGGTREQLANADRQLDRTVDQLLDAIARGVSLTPGLSDAISRARYADQQVHAALAGGGGPGPGPGGDLSRIARLVGAVQDQADDLRDRLRNAGADRTLDRGTRSFRDRLGRVRAAAEDGNLQQAQAEYQQAAALWGQLAAPLGVFGSRDPAVRQQTARTDGLFRALGERLNVTPGPVPPPGPQPPGFLGRGILAVGAGEGGGPRVRLFADASGTAAHDFFAYDPNFRGGVRVAVADLTGDGVPDLVTAPGAGMQPLVRVFDGRTLRLWTEFLAYDPNWTGGLFVAAADRTRDGRALVVTGTDVGAGPHVRVFDVATGREVDSFFAYDQGYRGGVRVALGDVDGDGRPDIVTAPGPGHPPQVRVFSGANRAVLAEFPAFDRSWTGGVQIAAADIGRNGRCEILAGSDAGGPNRARVFDGRRGRLIADLNPMPPGFAGGVRLACMDFDGDGVPDVVCGGGPDGRMPGQPIRVYSGRDQSPLGQFTPFEPTFRGGAFLAGR